MRRPDLDDLLGDVGAAERARLERVHDLLVTAGPPPDVPAALASPPATAVRRRRALAVALAAALAATAFAGGWFARGDADASFDARRVIELEPTARGGGVEAVIRLGARDDAGNWPMQVTVEGLRALPKGDYYEMFWVTENGKKISCGTFKVGGPGRTSVTFTVAYSLDRVRGWELSLYRARGHRDIPLARA